MYIFRYATDETIKVSDKEGKVVFPKMHELNTQSDDEPSEEGIDIHNFVTLNTTKK